VEVTTIRTQLDRLRAAIRDLQAGAGLAQALQDSSPAFAGVSATSVTDASTSEAKSSDKKSNMTLIIGVVVAAVVVLGILVLVLMTRAANASDRAGGAGGTQAHYDNPMAPVATTDVDRQTDANYMHSSNDVYEAEDPRQTVGNDTYDNGRQVATNDTYAVGEQGEVMNAWEDSNA